MKTSLDRILSVMLTVAACAIALTLVKREFFAAAPSDGSAAEPRYVEEWQDLKAIARSLGPASAPVRIVEFTDFECPFCRRCEGVLQRVRAEFGDDVAVDVVHFPLPQHAWARDAANATECAHTSGAFASMVDALFKRQDSLGTKPWTAFAVDAGIDDTVTFKQCMADVAQHALVDSGIAAGTRLKIDGTPAIMVNGWLYPKPPSDSALRRIISEIVADGERR